MCSSLSPAIAANLDTRGAVAVLAASTRPRLISGMRKKAAMAHSSQEEVPTSLKPNAWGCSFDSSRNVQSQDDVSARSGPRRSEDQISGSPVSKQSSFANRITSIANCGGNNNQSTNNRKLPAAGDMDGSIKLLTLPKGSVEQEALDEQDDDTLTSSSDMPRPKRPYYCQKAQKFRNSWRTRSSENPRSDIEHGLVRERSLTMVESQSDSDNKSTDGFNTDRGAQVKVYLTQGSRNPVKTILVNHNATSIAAAAQLRARRQRTFSNRNQWRSVQISPTHDVEIDRHEWRGEGKFLNTSPCESRDGYPNNRCTPKSSCACTYGGQILRRKRSTSSFPTSVSSFTEVAKLKQLAKSSEVAQALTLKPQTSHLTSEIKSSDDDAPCRESMFSIRQRRYIQNLHNLSHLTVYLLHNIPPY